jgi:2-polyprenyl-6-methoxyphenol hydroxylase-like FAD-dependent oxidoreductase
MTIETPVLIVGGGPVGLALALELGWRGVACTLIEQGDGAIATPKMNEVNTRTMEFCRRWGIAERVMNCPFPDDLPMDVAVVTRLGGYELGRVERPARRDQRPGPASPMNLQVCSQLWFDPMLREAAQSYAGVRLLYRHRLESFVETQDGVTAQATAVETGERVTIRARFLAGCDGANSRVRRAVGIGLEGPEVLSHSIHLFFRASDVLGRLGVQPGTFFAAIDRTGLWGNVRAVDPRGGMWRILFDVPEGFGVKDIDYDACLARALAKKLDVEWLGASQWTRRGVVAARYSAGAVHLVGDAVHQVSPTGALGMNTGIADAVDLGWKIAAVAAGWGGPNLLASYDAERRAAGARNVRMATAYYEGQATLGEGLDAIEDDTAEGKALRARVGERAVAHIERVFRTIGLQIGYRYDGSPIIVPDGTPPPEDDPAGYAPTARPGARAPHVPLGDGRSTLDLFGRGFVLLRLGAAPPDPGPIAAAAKARSVPIEVVRQPEPEIARTYERALVLVRPDGHVAWRADAPPADAGALIDRVRGA